ncbi:uncharacterized protein CTHT_0062340 [Thermochaetoides thermophila DSM 1495]|uniref:Uncharacterized protein n=1 Tax=Chaetomium thermophilum (strain DSM 1495 / CBS 144.50 / IMI 039719) TaxID=759272 RepID=G0SE41_CHATD|nr:hypothetical protein CTHT_0062340 [Thermochaetoides thermophila DSM 1495]EGS18218.1 hypothetical protein CTHT_0062340 [Thermochaetoides thermophila DSM 1495]
MAEEVPREEYHRRLHGTHDTIDLTGDDRRPESPTDVVIRRHGNMSNGLSNLRFTQNNVAGTSGQGRQDALTTLHNFASAGLSNGHDNTPAEDLEEGAANVSPTANSVIQDVANTQVNHPYGLAAPPNFRYVQLNEPLPPIGLHGRSVAEIINAIDWSHPVYAGPNRVVFISRHVIEVAAQFVHDKDELEKEINIFVGTVCKFMDNCNLYSNTARIPWRKALSHFFGRNKKCTRQVPENVWIVMCRKHYQRARYRNTTEYNKRLIRLIAFQVLRIENWSESNRLGGTPQNGIVESWSLQPRRREQMRIDEARKRKLEDDEDVEDDEDEMDDLDVPTPATSGGSSQIPDWLLEMCRDGYSTIDILRIILEIKVRLDSGELTQIPDIEILPKISGDQSQPRSKPRTGRVSKGTSKDLGHRRTQSLENPSAGLYRRHANASRRSSQPNDASRHDAKRQRRDNYQDESYEDDFGTYVGRAAERPDTLRTLPSTSSNLPSLSYGGYGAGANGPLPAPRSNMYNSAATGSFANTRPSHQRTFSDVSNLPWENTVTYNTSATGYDHSTNGMQQEVLHGPSFSSTAYPQWPEIGYAPRTQGASYHQQHQAPTTSYSPQSFFPPLSTSTPGTGASHSRQPSSSYMNGYSSATGGNASSGAHGGFAACYNAGRGSYSGGAQSGFGAAYNLGATSSASGAQGPYGNTYNPVNGQGHNAGYMSSPAGAQQYDGFDRTVDDESKRFDRH